MQSNTSARSSSEAPTVLGTWADREEARKLWDDFICDECVYFAKSPDVNGESPHVFAEKYVRNDLWFHIRWVETEPRQAGNYCNEALIEAIHLDESLHIASKLDGPIAAIDGNSPMFVEVPQFVELPEFMCVHGIRSVIRLKRVQGAVEAGMKQSAFLPITLIGPGNREGNSGSGSFISRNRAGKQIDQVPSELIERTAETVNEISNSERYLLIRRSLLRDYEKVLRSIRVVFFGNRIRVAFNPLSKSFLSRLEVKVSPSGFHIDVLN